MTTSTSSKILTAARWIVGIAGAAVAVRYLAARLGSTVDERQEELPGDRIVADCDIQADRAITINAPASEVWPWLVQLGQDRGGFYSFETLENLIGCDIHGSFEIHPEWQEREVGDRVRLAPGVSLVVAESEPGRHLVLAGTEEAPETPGFPQSFTWAFVLNTEGESTRLHVRERYRLASRWDRLGYNAVIVASCIMTEKMLLTIRDLAEQ